ncbi:Flp family type IVb pilin [Celeribacter sp. SCSIO 80788]|uniref:Flp family type IVb pilin n=1 Tax=Celeribacter sp. SCSIO 80788 TaxID=3117013 RepID=UPI003DA30875
MKFFKLYKNFSRDEDGAVTVDWVVLTSAVVGLGIAVLTTVAGGTKTLGAKISDDLSARTVIDYSDDATASEETDETVIE